MSYTVRMSERRAIALGVLNCSPELNSKGLLLSLEGANAEVVNCIVIPADKVGALIASLELARSQLKP